MQASKNVADEGILTLLREIAAQQGRVGIDCPLGWSRAFVAFVAAHAANRPLPTMEPGTQSLRLRATDLAAYRRIGRPPLSVSTNMLGVTVLRAARLLAELRDCGMAVDRTGRGTVCEVYPFASRLPVGASNIAQQKRSATTTSVPYVGGLGARGRTLGWGEARLVFEAIDAWGAPGYMCRACLLDRVART